MIADALATLWALGWAFLAWITVLAIAMTVAGYALVAVAWLTWRAVRWAWAGAWWGAVAAVTARRAPGVPEPLPEPPAAVQSRPARSRPAWARPDKEAA